MFGREGRSIPLRFTISDSKYTIIEFNLSETVVMKRVLDIINLNKFLRT